jgi:FAD dependent oxidoreductase TIGR03364
MEAAVTRQVFDLLVVGAGIVGLAHALAAARKGLRVAVVERGGRCTGASIRNFGFVTVTGQRAGDTWRRARRSRDIWGEVAPQAGIAVCHQGLWVLGQRPEAGVILEAFAQSDMGAECRLVSASRLPQEAPLLRSQGAWGALYSPHELRVESKDAVGQLAKWLQEAYGVVFFFGQEVLAVDLPVVITPQQRLSADRVVLCPGTELTGVAEPYLRPFRLGLTQLQMMRLVPHTSFTLPAAVMSDLSLVRYAGYTGLGAHAALLERLTEELPETLAAGIHLIVVQSADGSLVIGDSHHPAESVMPFSRPSIDRLILDALEETMNLGAYRVTDQWLGWYPVGGPSDALILSPDPALRVVSITSGTGASTAFGIAEEVLAAW